MGMCVSRREEDEAMIQLLEGCNQWRLTWLNIIASRMDHQGFVDLANVLGSGRWTIKSSPILFPSNQVGALGCQEGGVTTRVVAEPEEDVEVDQELLEGGQEGSHQTDPSGRGGWRLENGEHNWFCLSFQPLNLHRLRRFWWGAGSLLDRRVQPCKMLLPGTGELDLNLTKI